MRYVWEVGLLLSLSLSLAACGSDPTPTTVDNAKNNKISPTQSQGAMKALKSKQATPPDDRVNDGDADFERSKGSVYLFPLTGEMERNLQQDAIIRCNVLNRGKPILTWFRGPSNDGEIISKAGVINVGNESGKSEQALIFDDGFSSDGRWYVTFEGHTSGTSQEFPVFFDGTIDIMESDDWRGDGLRTGGTLVIDIVEIDAASDKRTTLGHHYLAGEIICQSIN